MLRFIVIVLVIVIGVAGVAALRTLSATGYFATVTPGYEGQCRTVPAPKGPEDFAIDRARGLIYISSTDRRSIMAGAQNARGDIFLMRLDAPQEGAVPLTSRIGEAPSDFRPHGISLYEGPDGRQTLMVVNHLSTGEHAIEIFDVVPDTLTGQVELHHRKSVTDPLLTSPNDVVAVGHDSFYAANDRGWGSAEPWGMIEIYLILPLAKAVYWNGREMSVAVSGLTFGNGIAASADGGQIYIAETTAKRVNAYERNMTTGELSYLTSVSLDAGPDNIDVASDGTLWVAAHPKMLQFAEHARNAETQSPSQVIAISAPGPRGGGFEARTVYSNLGDEISGSSTAASADGLLVISDVFEPVMAICQAGPGV